MDRPVTTGQGAAHNWTLYAFKLPENLRLSVSQLPPNRLLTIGRNMILDTIASTQLQFDKLFAIPWVQPSSPPKFKQTLEPVQQTLVYRIPHQGRYGKQIQRILRDAWACLTREQKQSSNLHMNFAFHPHTPRFVDPINATGAMEGVRACGNLQ